MAATACDAPRDETIVRTDAGSGGGGAGGSTAGPGGGAGSGGATDEGRDASADATPDGDTGHERCVLSTIDEYCQGTDDCPALADARPRLRRVPNFIGPRAIVQRGCVASDGSSRISVGAGAPGDHWTHVYVYAADTQQLVGVHVSDDLGGDCDRMAFEAHGFGIRGYYGENSPDCDFVIPSQCGWPERWYLPDAGVVNGDGGVLDASDAGADDAGADLRSNECIVAP